MYFREFARQARAIEASEDRQTGCGSRLFSEHRFQSFVPSRSSLLAFFIAAPIAALAQTPERAQSTAGAGALELPGVEGTAGAPSAASLANAGEESAGDTASAGTGRATDMNEAASAFSVTGAQVNQRIFARPAEALEIVPGLVVTQHSGDGKANQYFLRGFNLDHGTDLALFYDGMPLNMRTHAHGQGYADANFIIPELVSGVNIKKGPYFADEGDFASVGAVHINLRDTFDGQWAQATLGSFDYLRYLGLGSFKLGDGNLLYAGEIGSYDGPWVYPDSLKKLNGVLRYSQGGADNGFSFTAMAYGNHWNSTDQIPERAAQSDEIGLYGSLNPTDGGDTQRYSLSGRFAQTDANGAFKANFFAIRSVLNLWNDFTFFLQDPVNGDQFHQHESRIVSGANASYTFNSLLAGIPAETEFGVQTRFDDINLLLTNTAQRQYLSTIRQDAVKEGSIGVYAQQTLHWTDWFKMVVGVRGDLYSGWNDALSLPVNSGSPVAFVPGPKASLIFGPFNKTEFYINGGQGFHSNDLRGVTIKVEPADPINRLNPATFLTPTQGAEIGLRSRVIDGLNTSLALFMLDAASENIFSGDAGDTEPSRPTRRIGLEWTNDYRPFSWLDFEGDIAVTRSRFLGYDWAQADTYNSLAGYPEAQIGNAPGNFIPGAPNVVGTIGLQLGEKTGWFGGLQYRYLGARPLTEDNAFRSPATGLLNARVGYNFDNGWRIQLDAFNITNSRSDQITYAYGSLLKSDNLYAACNAAGSTVPAAVCQNGVMDRVFHPVEPLAFRLTIAGRF
ncbi:TonB-dependent receptor [Methylocapsa palsarum]|uniref:Outer membrane receptor proteins, mostly Fe transport n=1 Tax=Methylocapsa palsarum TaxID=1612308 RepID=A0A1I4BJW1_9HYPH|nr:TonB-dependent receptor [Methylocapsa palsarum]SFK69114.1 Outer membrane receptor proteins, mostly Fe transport [Methylocapsa palsarum]